MLKKILTIMFITLIVIILGVFAASIYVKLIANNISDATAYRTAISFGIFIFVIIVAGTFTAIEYINIYSSKAHENFIGRSELMRLLHNELKRYNGDELMLLSNEKNVLMILSELADLYKIAKLHYKRKVRTKPTGLEPDSEIDFDSIIQSLEGKIMNRIENKNNK